MNLYALDFVAGFKSLNKDTCKVLEVGSRVVGAKYNQNVRTYFPSAIGVDMLPGEGVDVVLKGEELSSTFEKESFGIVVSIDTFEHVENWRNFLRGIWHILEKDGALLLTVASIRKGRHNYPNDYWRLNAEIAEEIFKGNVILANRELERLSFGIAVIKKTDTLENLDSIRLLRVDDQVPADLI